jgi:hypothetical protein
VKAPLRLLGTIVAGVILLGLGAFHAVEAGRGPAGGGSGLRARYTTLGPERAADSMAGVQDFLQIARVLQSPRCQNCHPIGDAPLQTDAGRPHTMLVTRGPDGRGVTAMRCSNCHMRTNNPQPGGPPGAPTWHLPPPETPMVFEGKSPAELCRTITDPEQNGGKNLEQLVHHMTADSLVLWGWNPGPGRTLPPLSQPEFARVVREWAKAGAPCPAEGETAASGESPGPVAGRDGRSPVPPSGDGSTT